MSETISEGLDQLQSGHKVRCLVQQCTRATLQTRLADPANGIDAEIAEVTFKKPQLSQIPSLVECW